MKTTKRSKRHEVSPYGSVRPNGSPYGWKITFQLLFLMMLCWNLQEVKAQWVIKENTNIKVSTGSFINVHGDWKNNNPELDLGEGTIKFSGSENQNIQGANTFKKMLVEKYSNELELNGNLNCNGTLEIASGSFNVNPEIELTLNDDFTNNGAFTIKSDENGTGSLLDNGMITGNGVFTVEQFLTGGPALEDIWHYVSPQAEDVLSGIYSGGMLLKYNETISGFVPIETPDETLNVLQGYSASFDENTTVYYTGNLFTASQTITGLTYTENTSANYDGFNLVGNPYPSLIDIESTGITLENLGNAFYFWDNTLNGGLGDFSIYIKGGSAINGATQYISGGQGFFLKVDSPGNIGTFSTDNSARLHNGEPSSKDSYVNLLRLSAEGGVFSDETIICFNELATESFDSEFDAYKFILNDNINHLYSKTPEDLGLAINTLPDILLDNGISVPLSYNVVESGSYMITASELESFIEASIILEDILIGTTSDLNENPIYNFTANPEDDPDRFIIHFNVSSTQTQNYSLVTGYQFISTRLMPDDQNMLNILSENLESLDFVRNTAGLMLRKIGPMWVNGIGDWVTTEGYLFRMTSDDLLTISGSTIDPQTPIDLINGYQMISFLPESPVNTNDVFADVLSNLDFVRNSTGLMFRKIGPIWVNGIGDMQPGEGYLVRMNADDVLIYPETVDNLIAAKTKLPEHFKIKDGNPYDPVWTIYFEQGALNIGDEIGVYDGETLAGAGVVNSENILENSIPVFSNLNKNGNYPIFKIWSKTGEEEILLTDYSYINPYGNPYMEETFPETDGEYSMLNFSVTGISDNDNNNSSLTIYPNPSDGIFNISMESLSGDLQCKVFDLTGNEYRNIKFTGITGFMIKQLDLKDLPAGVYFISFLGRNLSKIEKIVIQ
ncbi:MAG: T9SS type A sorting domain-containing protein [Bacteroidales bacterium]|nr:T9SS type A sorting domain-containing protein [Bacteroidales bacterium]